MTTSIAFPGLVFFEAGSHLKSSLLSVLLCHYPTYRTSASLLDSLASWALVAFIEQGT